MTGSQAGPEEGSGTAAEATATAADLDRRVLGAGTTLRFALLVVLVLTSSVRLIGTIERRLDGKPSRDYVCGLAAGGGNRPGLDTVLQDLLDRKIRGTEAAYEACTAQGGGVPWLWLLAGVSLLLLVAVSGYSLSPWWKRRRRTLLPVRGEALERELEHLVRQAGLRRAPDFVIDHGVPTSTAVTFGHPRRKTVCLHSGLVVWRTERPDAFRTVVLHELAHIRNGDVGPTYLTEALWRAFVLVILLPYTALTVSPWKLPGIPGDGARLWREGWQLGLRDLLVPVILTLLVQLARADVLRTRELYADLDAGHWSGARSLSDLEPGTARHAGPVVRLARLWRTHPDWAERDRSLLDPAALFGIRPITMFLTGAAATMALRSLARDETFGLAAGPVVNVTVWMVAALITGVVGISLWRSITHAVLTGHRIPDGRWAGIWLGLGLAAGELLSFGNAGTGWLPPVPAVLIVLVAGSAGITWWAAHCAVVWIRTCRGRSLHAVHLLGLGSMLIVFGCWLAWWYGYGYFFMSGSPVLGLLRRSTESALPAGAVGTHGLLTPVLPAVEIILFTASYPMLPVGGLLLWLFPLAAWARRPVKEVPEWVRLALRPSAQRPAARHEPGGPAAAPPYRPLGLRPLRDAVLPGLAGAAPALAAMVAVRLLLHTRVGPPPIPNAWSWVLLLSMVAVVYVASVATAVATYWRTADDHPLPTAVIAGGTTMLAALFCAFFLIVTDGCVPPMAVFGHNCGWKTEAAWNLLQFNIGPVPLSLGMYLMVLMTPLGLALRTATDRWRRGHRHGTGAARPVKEHGHGHGHEHGQHKHMWWTATAVASALGLITSITVRTWLHGRRPARPSIDWLFHAYEWAGAAIVVAGVSGALFAAWATRARWRRRRVAVSLAATAAVVAALGASVLFAMFEDCLPPFALGSGRCDVRPRFAWNSTMNVLVPTALAVVLCGAGAAVIILMSWRGLRGLRGLRGVRRVRGPLEPAADPVTGTAAAPRGGPWPARIYLTVACIVLFALFADGWQMSIASQGGSPAAGGAASAPQTTPAPAPTPSVDSSTRREQLLAWIAVGGKERINESGVVLQAFQDEFRDGIPDARDLNPQSLTPKCEALAAWGRKVSAGLPAPDPELQRTWAETGRLAVQIGTGCAEGLRDHDRERAGRALGGFTEFQQVFLRFGNRLRELTADACKEATCRPTTPSP